VIEVHEGIRGPKPLAQFFAGNHGTGSFEQHSENRKRLFLKAQLAPLLAKLPRPQVDLENAKPEDRGVLGGWRVSRHAA
jgi:hypothetical protein